VRQPTLHVLVRGLLDSVSRWAKDYGGIPRYAGIEALLGKSSRHLFPAQGIEAMLCALFGLAATTYGDLPLGALRRYGFGDDADTGPWLCADPVYLRADVTRVFLQDSDSLNITRWEADRLAALISAHFVGEEWRLEVTAPAHWHLRLSAPTAIRTYPKRLVMGKTIEKYLPAGRDATHWRAILNEIQMLFHEAELNRNRAQRGEPPINGLWLSGAGVLPSAESLYTELITVWADDPVARGLSRLRGVEAQSARASLDSILSHGGRGPHLMCLEPLLAPASYDDLPTWSEILRGIDTQWFQPMEAAVKARRVAQVYIYDCAGQRFSLSRVRQWLAWRARKPLHKYTQAPDFNSLNC
jgi:hypothetical protein